MRLRIVRVEVRATQPAAIAVDWSATDDRVTWSLTNGADGPVAVDAVALVARLEGAVEPLRVLRHGYQSWTPTAVATFRVDQDPSRAGSVPSLVLGMHHADQSMAEPDELRSELVTAMRDEEGQVVVAGFLGGADHDGTFRIRPARDGSDAIEVWIEAFLGGAVLGSDERRELHDVLLAEGEHDPSPLLEHWAATLGAATGARTAAPYQVGWCSWYHYFHGVTETDLRAEPHPGRRLALRRVPARRRLPAGHRRLARHQRGLPDAARGPRRRHRRGRSRTGPLDRPLPRRARLPGGP